MKTSSSTWVPLRWVWRTDQHRVTDHDRVLRPATQDSVLHHEDIAPDDPRTVNRVDHRQVENSDPAPTVTSPAKIA